MRICGWVILGAGLVSSVCASDKNFDAFLDTFSTEWIRRDPQAATTQQYFSGAEQDALDRQLTPVTARFDAERVAQASEALDRLKQFDRTSFDAGERVSAAMLQWQLENVIEHTRFQDSRFVFEQFSGLQVALVNFLTQVHPIRSLRDAENYLARLQLVAGTLDDGISEARRRAADGYIPPRFILVSTLAQLGRFLSAPPAQNVLVTSLGERAQKVGGISAADRARLLAAAQTIVAESIVPAFTRVRDFLQEQLPNATDDAGVWRFPKGAEIYAQALHEYTTTHLSAAQVHELGLKEVARIEREMDGLFRQLGYATGSIQQRMHQMVMDSEPREGKPVPGQDREFASPICYAAGTDPRPAILARYEAILKDAEQRSSAVFDLRPVAPVVVKREPPFTEKNAASHYSLPAKDGSRPGTFWAVLPGPHYDLPGMRTLVYHEAVPGHHFQTALQQENADLPRFRRNYLFGFISAHGEGWALYAEQLAAELGWYEGDPRGRLGQLNDELFRARRLVVDTGLHAMRWTRQQAIDYGIPASEVERYVVWPGQACSYKVGQLRILELRAKAKATLGVNFSLKEFHNVVLRTGGVPLEVLDQVISDFIAAGGRSG